MGNNAVNAFNAHAERVGNDNNFVRGVVESYTLIGFGVVKQYADERISVSCGDMLFTNVEVMVLGINGWGIKPVPAVGDRVLLLSTQTPVPDIKVFAASGSMPPYDASGLKAIPVTDSVKATQLITVDKDKIKLTGLNKVTVDSSGVQFEDSNGNKVSTTTNGVSFEDRNHNKVTTTSNGIELEDNNGNRHNKITTSSSGVIIADTNGNSYTANSSGVTIEDKNSNKIVMGSSNVTINSKLEIGH